MRREHLVEVGRRIRLKHNIDRLAELLAGGIDGYHFSFYVVSAAPEEVVQSALEGIVPARPHLRDATSLRRTATGEIESIVRVSAGYGKVAVLDELQRRLQVSPDHVVYVGDGSSDVHVMLHVNRPEGYTIAVSEAKYLDADRPAHDPERRRAERAGADPGGHRRLEPAAHPRALRAAGPADPGAGTRSAPTS